MKWYVAQVMTGKEEAIMKRIQNNGSCSIVPKRIMQERKNGRWHNVERVLFPSYIFVLIDSEPMEADMYYFVTNIPGVIKFLGDERGPVPIRDEETNILLRLSQNGDPLGLSKIFVEGEKIKVVEGPLKGLEGNIIKLEPRRMRAKVTVNFMGEVRVVELGVNVIKPQHLKPI